MNAIEALEAIRMTINRILEWSVEDKYNFYTNHVGGIFVSGQDPTPKFVKNDSELAFLIDAYNYFLYGKARKI